MLTTLRLLPLAFAALCFSLACAPSFSAEKTLIIGAEDSWPPYSDKNGKGISTNIIRAAFASQSIHIDIRVKPYARVLHEVKSGALQAGYNVTRQENTEREYIFGKIPILKAKAYWYFSPQKLKNFSSIQDIPSGFSVGGIINYEYGDEYEKLRHKFREVRVPKQSQLIKMLESGRVDAVIMFEEEAKQALRDMQLPPSTIKKGLYNHTSDIYVVFSKKHKDSVEMAKALDKGLLQLKSTGEYFNLLREIEN